MQNLKIICLIQLLFFGCISNYQKEENKELSDNRSEYGYDMRTGLSPQRLTIAMWDFSWLTCHYKDGPYEDYEKVCDELIERGFNTVRIDAFPLVIGKLDSLSQEITIPGSPLDNWGPTDADRKHKIVSELISFMEVTSQKGLWVILSTWNSGCIEFPDIHDDYRDRKEYWKSWEKVLDLLKEENLLDHVVYVDLDQEFPNFSPFNKRIKELGGDDKYKQTSAMLAMEAAGRNSDNLYKLDWNEQQMSFIHDLLRESLIHFQEKYPGLRFTFSFTDHWDEFRAMHIHQLDVLELHIWMTQSNRFHSRTKFSKIVKDRGDHDYSDYMDRINKTLLSIEPMLKKELHNRLKYAKEWSESIAAPLVTTEAWGPWWHMDHPDLDWEWLYDWCEQGMALSAEYGFWGSTPWNFSHPYWENWENIQWYQRVNNDFLKSK